MPIFSPDCKTITVFGMFVGTIKSTMVEDMIFQHFTQESKEAENQNASRGVLSRRELRDIIPGLIAESGDMELDEYFAHLLLGLLFLKSNTKLLRQSQEGSEQTMILRELCRIDKTWDFTQLYGSIENISNCRTVAETESLDIYLVP